MFTYLYADAAYPWQLGFQDGASPAYEGIELLHDTIFFWVLGLAGLVFWILGAVIVRFRGQLAYRYFTHGTALEVIWTILPAVVLVAIAFPSFQLLYLMDEVLSPTLTIKVAGSQWFWSYEYSDFINAAGESVEFDSYMVPEPELGQLRLLDVDNRVLIPVDTHVRFIVTAKDVIHDWAVPSLGVKIDAVPGRLNQVSVLAQREGVFYGQCSELCGVYHGFMPIAVEAVSLDRYVSWLEEQL
jgi:cytochrome c oxidase subunit 2